MKILLSESQLKCIIKEQTATLTANPQTYTSQPTTNVKSGTVNATDKGSMKGPTLNQMGNMVWDGTKYVWNKIQHMDSHDWSTVVEIAAACLIPPPAGLFLASSIGILDAGQYYKEGNKKMAGISVLLASIPMASELFNEIPGAKELGTKGFDILADKISKGITTLLPEESRVMKYIATNHQHICQEYSQFINNTARKLASQTVSNTTNNGASFAYDYVYNNPDKTKDLVINSFGPPGIFGKYAYDMLKGIKK
jgi:hypothetical protein